jgi:hypothetical protein
MEFVFMIRTIVYLVGVIGVFSSLSAEAAPLREMIQLRWTRFVARRNGIGLSETAVKDLRRFLFPV